MNLQPGRGIGITILTLTAALVLASGTLIAQDQPARKVMLRVSPQYPSLARSMKIESTVRADVLVGPNGLVKAVEIKGGHPLFVQAAQNALREWKWEPTGHETHELIELKFKL